MCTFQATTVKPISSLCRHFFTEEPMSPESESHWISGCLVKRWHKSACVWFGSKEVFKQVVFKHTSHVWNDIYPNIWLQWLYRLKCTNLKKKKGWKCPKSPEDDVPLDSFALEVSKWVKNTSRKVRELTLWGCCVCQALSTLWWLVCEFTSDQYLCTENDVVKLLGFQKNILVLGYMLWVTYTIQRGKLWLSANGRNVLANTFQLRNLFNALLRIMYSMVICARGLLSCN